MFPFQNGGHFYNLRLNISKTVNLTKLLKETKELCNFIFLNNGVKFIKIRPQVTDLLQFV